MAKQYKALKPIGRFNKGDFIGGLTEAEIQKHKQLGNIEEVKVQVVKPKEVKVNG